MKAAYRKLISVIETISQLSGKAISYLLLVLIAVIVHEVIQRYVLGRPTVWGFETILFLAGAIYVIGGAYTHSLRGHIIVDCVYNLFSPRKKAILDIFIGLPVFLAYVGIMLYFGTIHAWDTTMAWERSGSFWNPIIFPFRWLIPLGALLILLQQLAISARDIETLITGKAAEERGGYEEV